MPYKLVIFDFDGTLANSVAWTMGVLGEMAERFGFRRPSDAELEALRHIDNRTIISRLGIPMHKIPLMALHMRKLVARDADRIPLYAGVPELLRSLDAAGVQLAVVSSNSEENVRRILGAETAARIRHYGCG